MKVVDCEQGTEEWFAARLGLVTASHFKDVLNKKTTLIIIGAGTDNGQAEIAIAGVVITCP